MQKEQAARGVMVVVGLLQLLGAGRVFGSAHCIISISPNLPEQTSKRRGGKPALLRASALVLDIARCSCSTSDGWEMPALMQTPLINRTGRCVSLGAIMSPGQAPVLLKIFRFTLLTAGLA